MQFSGAQNSLYSLDYCTPNAGVLCNDTVCLFVRLLPVFFPNAVGGSFFLITQFGVLRTEASHIVSNELVTDATS